MTIKTTCLAVILLFGSAVYVNAQLTDSREPLRNLGGVGVWYKYDAEDLNQIGLTPSLLANDVTLRLRKAGISVLEQDDKGPHFVLNLKTFKGKEGLIVFSVSAQVSQWISLPRLGNRALYAPTWTSGGVLLFGYPDQEDVTRTVRDAIGDVVDKFINDYLAVNPKPLK
jgi:hypothetical protein